MEGDGVILDTHTLLWIDRNDPSVGMQARQQVEAAWRSAWVAVSAISFWEVAMLAERGRVALSVSPEQWRLDWLQAGLIEIPVDGTIVLKACRLEDFHRDPADRFIVATALAKSASLVSADREILDWEGDLDRIDARV
ncbi:type II toxin-antitoxin system VapC family toxin [Spiribacter sp. 221]|uniref:type II toxin-antitoxin system VapC family toxin n=1 Tax=Spiribacter onubensis TaxID=3122420 RepID=UPI00349FC07D